MKRICIWLSVAVVVIATVVAIRAETHSWHRWHGHSWGPRWYAAHELNLSDAQKKQIGTIWTGERPRVAVLVGELATQQEALRAAAKDKNERKVQEIASQQGATLAKLLMEKERMCGEIYASVLTPEQRKKADALQDKMSEHLKHLADQLEQGGTHEN